MSSSSPFELPRSVSLRSIRVRFRSASMDHRWMTRGIVDRSALYRCEEPPGRCDVVVGNIPSSVAPTLTAFERSTTSPVSMICAQTYYGISQKADNINTGQPTVVSRLLCKFGARSSALEPLDRVRRPHRVPLCLRDPKKRSAALRRLTWTPGQRLRHFGSEVAQVRAASSPSAQMIGWESP